MKAVDGKASPPPELRVAWLCQRFPGALPDNGPVFEQDYTLMMRMQALLNVYEAVSAMRGAKGDEIHKLSPHHSRVLASLVEMGITLGMGG